MSALMLSWHNLRRVCSAVKSWLDKNDAGNIIFGYDAIHVDFVLKAA
jgi:hypothetical protein